MPGRVIVRIETTRLSERPWLHALVENAKSCGGRIEIAELSAFMAQQAEIGARFTMQNSEVEAVAGERAAPTLDAFGKLSARAIFASGLYWHLILEAVEKSGQNSWLKRLGRPLLHLCIR